MNKIQETIYNHSPSFLQNIGLSLYGLRIYFQEYGKKFQRKLEEFERMQWYSAAELREYQNEKLWALIKHCYENVPYYRKVMGDTRLKPADIRSVDDLHKFPVLTSEDIRNNLPSLVAKNFKRSQLKAGYTGGTSGSPLKIFYDDQVSLIKNVVDWRQKRWAGINPGDKMALFWGRIVVPGTRNKPPFWRSNWIFNHLYFSSYHLSDDNLEAYIRQLEKFVPKAWEGYPSSTYVVARYLLSRQKRLSLKAVFTSSETLFPHQREAIEQAFECRVFDYYGLAERTIFATECSEHEGDHVNTDFGITEILNKDLQPVTPGEMGRIVATGLYNYGMPLIRYMTNDITALKTKKCVCGREFPLMENVTSRAEDIVTTKDGRYISFASLTLPFKQMRSLVESQVIQEDLGYIRIKIVRRPGYNDNDTQYLLNEFKKRIGADTRVEIEFVDSIPRTKAGKFRFVISKVPPKF